MGSDAEVYVFDDVAYRTLVVPFVRTLLCHGIEHHRAHAMVDYLRPRAWRFLHYIRKELRGLEPVDLEAHCTYLSDDLGLITPPAGLVEKLASSTDEWEDRACRRSDCPARASCPYHIDTLGRPADDLAYLFQSLVAAVCLGESQFVGRNFDLFGYCPVLQKNGVSWDSELGRLLADLGLRGAVVGYSFGGATDGIHGWLSHDETRQLAALLAPIRLPSFEPSFEAMRQTYIPREGYELEGWEFEELSLAFVRTTATIAAESGRGLLWGSDVLGVVDARMERP